MKPLTGLLYNIELICLLTWVEMAAVMRTQQPNSRGRVSYAARAGAQSYWYMLGCACAMDSVYNQH